MKTRFLVSLLLAAGTGGWLPLSTAQAENIAPLGTGILGVKATVDGAGGVDRYNSGTAANINDGNPNTRVDNWYGGGGTNNGPVSYVGIVWPYMRYDKITDLTLTLASFTDGGWFGVAGYGPGEGGALVATNLIAPTLQVSTNSGSTWTTVTTTSDYVTTMDGFSIGGGANPNPNPSTIHFTLTSPVSAINGIRLIGQNGGSAGDDANGFLGVFELEVNASAPVDTDGDGFSDAMEMALGGDPKDPNIFPSNFALIGTAFIGTKPDLDSGSDTEVPLENAGTAKNINDGVLASHVDNWNSGDPNTVSYVGIRWAKTLTKPIARLELTLATFLDGGWFGPNNAGPGAGGALTSQYLTEPRVEITKDDGATWTTVASVSDYLTALNGHGIGGGANPNPSSVTAVFMVTNAANPNGITGFNGIRLIGTEGGTASGGFIGVYELTALAPSGDANSNGMPDDWERLHFGLLGVDPKADADSDGLSNLDEYKAGTDPKVDDTDGDTLKDGPEVAQYHTDPLKPDTDGDTLSDGLEVNRYRSNPLLKDSDGDGFADGLEVSMSTDPSDPTSYPDNIAPLGTGILGTKEAVDSGVETEVALFHAGTSAAIIDGNLTTSVDTYNGSDAGTASFVGVLWSKPVSNTITRLELSLAVFFDGGWFGVNGVGPGTGGKLNAAEYLVAPVVETTKDGGASWTVTAATTDYLTALEGLPLPTVDYGAATLANAKFDLTTPQTGINGIRLVGTDGGTASGGFLGVFELAVKIQKPAAGVKLLNPSLASGQFRFEFVSRSGATHVVQYKPTVSAGDWRTLKTIAGDGQTQQVADNLADSARVYRVTTQ